MMLLYYIPFHLCSHNILYTWFHSEGRKLSIAAMHTDVELCIENNLTEIIPSVSCLSKTCFLSMHAIKSNTCSCTELDVD